MSQESELDFAPGNGEGDRDLMETKEKLLALKRQMEEYEQRERELENLRIRRQEVINGQKQMREKLTRALAVLERSEFDARREVEQIQIARQAFGEHLQQIEEIAPSDWQPEDLEENLSKAMSQIDHARTVYNQSRARIGALSGQETEHLEDEEEGEHSPSGNPEAFFTLVTRGFAFTLPLILMLAILIAVLLIR